jgi:hypothetical protein
MRAKRSDRQPSPGLSVPGTVVDPVTLAFSK